MNLQPVDNLTITFGVFQLSFVSNATGLAIPWLVIGQFASEMIDWSRRGYTGTYNRGYWDGTGTFGVFVCLRMAGDWWPVCPGMYHVQLGAR